MSQHPFVHHSSVSDLRSLLRSTSRLGDEGVSGRGLLAAVASGALHRVRRGWFIDGPSWNLLWAESQHLAHVVTVAEAARGARVVFSHTSAAVLWGLPLYRLHPRRVHVMMAGTARHSIPDVLRHEGALAESDIARRYGLLCTGLARTVYDLTRTVSPEAGLAAADAALAMVARRGRGYDSALADEWVDRMLHRDVSVGARGIRQARRLADLADGRAESPGESVSRLQLHRIGFASPALQVRVSGPGGADWWVDFGLDDVGAFGEFDGRAKYTDQALRHGLSLEEVLLREKQREDWIRGTTQRRFARWGDEHIGSPEALRARLAGFGICPPR